MDITLTMNKANKVKTMLIEVRVRGNLATWRPRMRRIYIMQYDKWIA